MLYIEHYNIPILFFNTLKSSFNTAVDITWLCLTNNFHFKWVIMQTKMILSVISSDFYSALCKYLFFSFVRKKNHEHAM